MKNILYPKCFLHLFALLLALTVSACKSSHETFGDSFNLPTESSSSVTEPETKITLCEDADGDGFGSLENCESAAEGETKEGFSDKSGDCNDDDESINPDAEEILGDEIDQNCDGIDGKPATCFKGDPLTLFKDADGDGFGLSNETIQFQFACDDAETLPEGFAFKSGDCDDEDNTVFPGAPDDETAPLSKDCNKRD